MTRTKFQTRTWILLAGIAAFTAAPRVAAQTMTSAAGELDARLKTELGVAGGLTSEQVAARASATSFDVRARRAEVLEAAAEVDRAASGYIPRLTATARYTRVSDESGDSNVSVVAAPTAGPGVIPAGTPLVNVPLEFPTIQNQYSFQAGLVVPLSDYFTRIGPSHSAAEHGVKAATFSEQASRRKAATDARLAYYGWVRARLDLIVAERSLVQSEAHLNDVKLAEQAGSATRADVLAVEAQRAQSELFVERARSLTRLTEEQVRTVMHESTRASLVIGENVLIEMPRVTVPNTVDGLWAEARQRRPELKALSAQARAIGEQAEVERAGYLPRVDAFANGYYANPNQRVFPQKDEFRSSWDLGLQLSWTVSDIPGAAAGGRSADARRSRVLADRSAFEDSMRIEVARAREDEIQAAAAVKASAEQRIAAEEAYRVRRALFQVGRATSVELSDAENELTRARLEALRARVDQRVARAKLLYAIGRG
jgi:outer membrane protein TolC